jgi:CRISPR-associated protein Cmr6
MKGNIGYWFNRQFLKNYCEEGIPLEDKEDKEKYKSFKKWVKKEVEKAIDARWEHYANLPVHLPENRSSADPNQKWTVSEFSLTTTYPGLVCGVGYEHEMKFEGEFKLGFSFDHTSGMPYIPGSSIKGVLRSVFCYPEYLNKKTREIYSILKSENPEMADFDMPEIDWRKMERCIFEGIKYDGTPKRSCEKDVFFDAFIRDTISENRSRFFADDYITAHHFDTHGMSQFKDPNPVRFIKVRSGVSFRFQFALHDDPVSENWKFTAAMKIKLFMLILKDTGLGAKTNVGYGQFE